MSALRRAKEWEISESEDSDNQLKQEPFREEALKRKNCKSPARPPEASCGTPSRKRRTKEEIEAVRKTAKERRDERERQKAARAKEKEQRRQAAEYLKSLRPENCLKSLNVCVDTALLQFDGSDTLLHTLTALQWKFTIESQQLCNSITWRRDLLQVGEENPDSVAEEQIVLVLTVTDFLDLVMSVRKLLDSEGEEEMGSETVLSPLLACLNQDPRKVVTLLVTDVESYDSTKIYGDYFQPTTLQDKLGLRSAYVDELVYLQLCKSISVVFVDSWQNITDHVCAVSKALSKRPYKVLTECSELPFCVDGSWAAGARVERDGSGLSRVWSQQIQQLNRVSPAAASAMTAAFPSPQLLLQAYEALGSEAEKKAMLADVSVASDGKERRLGAEIATRVYRCFTVDNPQLVLD